MLTPDKLTVKAAEALQSAAQEARRRGNAEIHGVHLLHALLTQEEGIVVPILQKLEVPVALVRSRAVEALDAMARVEGGADANFSRDLRTALDYAVDVSSELGDDFVSTEHLLLGLTGEKNDAGRILRELGATLAEVREALEGIRGSHRVTDANPEESFRALERYLDRTFAAVTVGEIGPLSTAEALSLSARLKVPSLNAEENTEDTRAKNSLRTCT